MNYKIVECINKQDFIMLCNNMIKDGYKPLGGIAIDNYGAYVQAFIKE
jgi:hypothetical protein